MFIPVVEGLSSSITRQVDGSFEFQRHLDRECRSFTNRGAHLDAATEQVGQALSERQAEPRAAVPTCRRAVDLTELVEHVLLGVERDPDSGVLYAIHDPVVGERYTCN